MHRCITRQLWQTEGGVCNLLRIGFGGRGGTSGARRRFTRPVKGAPRRSELVQELRQAVRDVASSLVLPSLFCRAGFSVVPHRLFDQTHHPFGLQMGSLDLGQASRDGVESGAHFREPRPRVAAGPATHRGLSDPEPPRQLGARHREVIEKGSEYSVDLFRTDAPSDGHMPIGYPWFVHRLISFRIIVILNMTPRAV